MSVNVFVAVAFLLIGIGMGVGLREATPSSKYAAVVMEERSTLLEECQKALPRNQFCVIKTTAVIKEIED